MSETDTEVEVSEEEPKLKVYKVVSKPEGEPTFERDGVIRPFMRQTVVHAPNEKIAQKLVEASNWDCHIAGEEYIYEVVSVEEEE